MNQAGRRRAWRSGRRAETLCAWLLRLYGYKIVARGYRTAVGEIDIIAQRRSLLAFIEVKRRQRPTDAAASLNAGQRRRIQRAAGHFLASHPDTGGLDLRFDVMLVSPWQPIRHLKDAWREGD